MTRSISLFILLGVWWHAGAADIDEYTVKAAYLYNFAKFVEWPAEAFHGPADPISICVVGQNPFGRKLREAVDGKLVGGRRFALRHLLDVGQAAGCHIVFVASSERDRFGPMLEDLKANGILTGGRHSGVCEARWGAQLQTYGEHGADGSQPGRRSAEEPADQRQAAGPSVDCPMKADRRAPASRDHQRIKKISGLF